MTNIAFIGVGNMGGPMARNLLKSGHDVSAFDLSAAVLEPVLKAGAVKAASANDAVKDADVVVTMLPAGHHVRSVYLDNGILSAAKKGALLIDSSTIDIDSARAVHAAAEKAGFEVFVTADQNLSYQQNLAARKISIVVLGQSPWWLVRQYLDSIVAAVNEATPGSYAEVDIPFK